MDAYLTRRGKFVVLVTVGCILLGSVFGARSLNAIVAPAVVALVASFVSVRRAPAPTIHRTAPPDGHPDETHAVSLQIGGCGSGIYELRDRVGAGLSAPDAAYDVTETSTTVSYDVRYTRRGVHRLGPLSITVTDVLGLAERELQPVDAREQILVYPELVDPPRGVRSALETVVDLEQRPGRDEFDSLREYVRGDSLRDVHWKSSAKQPDEALVVKEFVGRTPTDAVRLAVAPSGDRATVDAAARAAASVAVTLLDEGVEVGIETPRDSIDAGVGSAQRESILAALARLQAGEPTAADSTIRISAADGEAVVHAGSHAVPFTHGRPQTSNDVEAADGVDDGAEPSREVVS
ncbi:hypothetical protein L593_12565 [Salinarchaeum sp. Harcht-Bsk1]|uniref:DUF58 domain-containing protein n=1 Tax=Salinarchaeum sp. Harcht-Bsk1 TaxID=1333523 RepID=UPI0003424954|nr:DUF58 domain-containing protein [Salinarchaeum sp. Harcht-Bsk1]AGN02452.1 hypothetical protein L593_12565 [Salinarchaeum sp. Harcht-Bsk1]